MNKKPAQIRDIASVEVFTRRQIRFGDSSDTIIQKLKYQGIEEHLKPGLVEEVVRQTCYDFPNYSIIQLIMQSRIAIDKDSRDIRVIDYKNKRHVSITQDRLRELFDPKVDLEHKKYFCDYVYNPERLDIFYRDGDFSVWQFNIYQPPFWLEDYYYSGGKKEVPRLDTIPELYSKFLKHLVNEDPVSYNYILDWISNALHRRNYCILTTIGNQGIGKGVLGNIMKGLFGDENYFETKNILKGKFNGQLYGKKLVYCDEIDLKTKEEEDRLKSLINDTIEVEEKYKEAKNTDNYGNIYLSSNNIDSIRLTADDRRFSIVNLTDIPLISKYKTHEIESLLDPENVRQLAHYLYYREVDVNRMSKVLITEHTEKVRAGRLFPWQDYFLDEYCYKNQGKVFKVQVISDAIMDKFGGKFGVGRRKLSELQTMYPQKFKVVYRPDPDSNSTNRIWMIEILKEPKNG